MAGGAPPEAFPEALEHRDFLASGNASGLVSFRLIPNCRFQHDLTQLLGWLILRSALPGLARFDVWFQQRRQPAKVFPDGL
jgi:hypothetical protein